MDILIRFWDEENKVDTKYFDSSFLDAATATDIQEAFHVKNQRTWQK